MLFLVLALLTAHASDGPEVPEGTPVQHVDFDVRDVHATAVGPEIRLVVEPPRLVVPPMIQLRLDSDTEIRASLDAVR